jgi:uncharacterized RDD family membrane protein YckC
VTTFREYREGGATVPEDAALRSMPKAARALQGERAGFVSRLLAAGIDVTLVFVVVLGTVAVLWMLSFLINPVSATSPAISGDGDRIPAIGVLILYGYFLNWLYWTVCWAASGRTLGNLVMGLKVVNFRGRHMSWGGAAVRSLFCTTFPVGLVWVIVSGANRSVQDVVIRTSVIYDWVLKTPNLAEIFTRHEAKSKAKESAK